MLTNSQAQPRTEVRRKQKDPEKHTARGLIAGGPVLIITELRSNELIIMMGGETFPGLSASSGLPQRHRFPYFDDVAEQHFAMVPSTYPLDGIVPPFPCHNGSIFRDSLTLRQIHSLLLRKE